MATLEQAIALAVEAHKGQKDKYGKAYILHPLRVMLRLTAEMDQIVAVLHDVIEDSPTTFDDLRRMGFSEAIIEALDGVTRRETESYEEFVTRSGQHPVSRRVKLADLEDNMDIRRIPVAMTSKDFERLERYRQAWEQLQT